MYYRKNLQGFIESGQIISQATAILTRAEQIWTWFLPSSSQNLLKKTASNNHWLSSLNHRAGKLNILGPMREKEEAEKTDCEEERAQQEHEVSDSLHFSMSVMAFFSFISCRLFSVSIMLCQVLPACLPSSTCLREYSIVQWKEVRGSG